MKKIKKVNAQRIQNVKNDKRVKRALFIGRFQPFHKGHLEVVKKLLKTYDELIVAVGSAEASISQENPFTAGERLEMVRSCFSKKELLRLIIIPIRDVNDHTKWVSHVKNYLPDFEAVYSNNELVRKLFYYVGMSVHAIDFFNRHKYEGNKIRQIMAMGKNEWQHLVPKTVADFINSRNAHKRLRRI